MKIRTDIKGQERKDGAIKVRSLGRKGESKSKMQRQREQYLYPPQSFRMAPK